MKKFFKYALYALLLLLVFAGLGFTTFVYNVFEGSIADIRKGIPRNVDYYVGKAKLGGDFIDFPEPAFWPVLTESAHYPQLRRSQLGRFVERDLAIEKTLEEIARVKSELSNVPVVAPDILEDMIGVDLAIAGRLPAQGNPNWCLYTRVSWKLCAFVGLLGHESFRTQVAAGGLKGEAEGKLFRLTPDGGQTIYLARVLDLLMVGDSKELVEESRQLASGDSKKDTLFVSPDYSDLITERVADWAERTGTQPNSLEFKLDLRALAKRSPAFAQWPGQGDSVAQEMKLIRSVVNTKSMLSLWGSLNFEQEEISTLLSIDLNRNALEDAQRRFLNEKPASISKWLKARVSCVPETASGFMFLRVPVSVFLEEYFRSMDRDTRDLIDRALRQAGQRGGSSGLAAFLAPALKPYVIVITRNNQYRKFKIDFDVKVPSPAPATAWVFETARGMKGRVKKVLDLMRRHYKGFGFTKHFYMDLGPSKSVRILEWANANIPGTGEVAIMDGGDQFHGLFMVSNSGPLLEECVNARFSLGGTKSMLANEKLQTVLRSYDDDHMLSGFVWAQGDQIRNLLKKFRRFAREEAASTEPDASWMIENRTRIEDQVYRRGFASRARSKFQLSGKDKQDFDQAVKKELRSEWGKQSGSRGKTLNAAFDETSTYLQFLDSAYLAIRNGPRAIQAEGRLFFRF